MCNCPVYVRDEFGGSYIRPCGSCLGCRIDKTILWSGRCSSEYIKRRSAFVTLTYDTNHLVYGENQIEATLCRKHLTQYIDNLRHFIKRVGVPVGCDPDFAYVAVGEYGDSFGRPHIHLLFFGLDFHDCEKYFSQSWKNGFVKTLPLQKGGIRYVLDYMFKNFGSDSNSKYLKNGLEKPFFSCSKSLGLDYFFANKDSIVKDGYIKSGSRKIPVPTYYKNMLMSFDSEEVATLEYNQYLNFLDRLKLVKAQGYTDYIEYINEQRKLRERSLASKFRSKGYGVYDCYSDFNSGYSKSIALEALNYEN